MRCRVLIARGPYALVVQVGLKPGLSVGTTALACFVPGTDVTKAQSFGWWASRGCCVHNS